MNARQVATSGIFRVLHGFHALPQQEEGIWGQQETQRLWSSRSCQPWASRLRQGLFFFITKVTHDHKKCKCDRKESLKMPPPTPLPLTVRN